MVFGQLECIRSRCLDVLEECLFDFYRKNVRLGSIFEERMLQMVDKHQITLLGWISIVRVHSPSLTITVLLRLFYLLPGSKNPLIRDQPPKNIRIILLSTSKPFTISQIHPHKTSPCPAPLPSSMPSTKWMSLGMGVGLVRIFKKLIVYNNFAMEQPEQLDYQIYKDYQIQEKLGKGTYGVVFRGRHKRTERVVAIKKIIDAFQNLIDAKRTYRQLNYLLQLDHPCIVRLEYLLNLRRGPPHEPSTSRLVVPLQPTDPRGATTDKLVPPAVQGKHVYAVFQCMETDLACALQKCQQLQPIQRKYLAYQLLQGLAYLHRSGLVHRDIKPSNLLLNCAKLELKICDFGMARLKVEGEGVCEGVLTEYVASRWYRPPEGLLGITTCSESIDMWSAGCVLAELVLRAPLFRGKSTVDQLQLILKCIGMPSAKEIDRLPSEGAQFMLRNFSFSRRCKMRGLQETLSACTLAEIDLIMNLLRFDPDTRMTAEEALRHQYFSDIRTPQIEKFGTHVSKILDFSLAKTEKPQPERSNCNPGIEHYRMLIEELQKYAQRSTNRSGNIYNQSSQGNPLSKGDQTIEFQHNLDHSTSNHEPFKEKSTKESDFVTINKHHYLSSTHSLIHNQEEPKINKEVEEKTKTVVEQGKMKKMKKKKTISKADIIDRAQIGLDKSEKAIIGKKQIKKQKDHNEKASKPEVKERKAFTVAKKSESLHKNGSTKNLIKQRPQSVNQKKILMLYTQPLPKKRQSEQKDNKSLLSKSSSSLYRHSKQKAYIRPPNDKLKLNPQLKTFLKPSLNLNKSAILKCKSPKFSTQFKKSP